MEDMQKLLALYEAERLKVRWQERDKYGSIGMARRFADLLAGTGISPRTVGEETVRDCLKAVYEETGSLYQAEKMRNTIITLVALAVREWAADRSPAEKNPLEGLKILLCRRGKTLRVTFEPELSEASEELLRKYEEAVTELSRNEKPRKTRRMVVRHFLAWMQKKRKRADAVRAEELREYYATFADYSVTMMRWTKTVVDEFLRMVYGPDSRLPDEVTIGKGNGYLPAVVALPKKYEPDERERKELEDFAHWLILRGEKTGTAERHRIHVMEYLLFLADRGKKVLLSTETDLEEYRSTLLASERILNRWTINNKISSQRLFYRCLYEKGATVCNIGEEVRKLPLGIRIPRNILTVENMGRLLAGLPVKTPLDVLVKTCYELLYGCALRLSEVLGLRLPDIERGYIIITEEKNRGRRRRVPLAERTEKWLKAYCETAREHVLAAAEKGDGWLFPQNRNAVKTLLNVRVKVTCRKLGLPELSTHSMRHSAATHMLKAGAGMRDVQAFLGHEQIRSTQVYTRVVKEDLKKCVTAFHPREILYREDRTGGRT